MENESLSLKRIEKAKLYCAINLTHLDIEKDTLKSYEIEAYETCFDALDELRWRPVAELQFKELVIAVLNPNCPHKIGTEFKNGYNYILGKRIEYPAPYGVKINSFLANNNWRYELDDILGWKPLLEYRGELNRREYDE